MRISRVSFTTLFTLFPTESNTWRRRQRRIIWQDVNKRREENIARVARIFYKHQHTKDGKVMSKIDFLGESIFHFSDLFRIVDFTKWWQSDSKSEITHSPNHRAWWFRFSLPEKSSRKKRELLQCHNQQTSAVCLPSPCDTVWTTLKFEGSFEFECYSYTGVLQPRRLREIYRVKHSHPTCWWLKHVRHFN